MTCIVLTRNPSGGAEGDEPATFYYKPDRITQETLLDAVNDAVTQAAHDVAEARLTGWREGVEFCGRRVDFIAADMHTMGRFGEDRPMCCGVLLDWRPA